MHMDLGPRRVASSGRKAAGFHHAGIFGDTRDAQAFEQIDGGADDQFSLATL